MSDTRESKYLLTAERVSKKFERSGREFDAVSEIDFALKAGEFVHIIGRSGSGKSTFLSLLSGLLKPSAGTVRYCGEDIGGYDDAAVSTYRNECVGVIPQFVSMMPNLSVLENIVLPKLFAGRSGVPGEVCGGVRSTTRSAAEDAEEIRTATERARILLEKLEIPHLANQFPRQLSGGEVRRAMIARAMLNQPKLLLADEPTADLDAKSGAEVMRLFRELHGEGVSLVVVTHERECLDYGDRVVEMAEGRLLS